MFSQYSSLKINIDPISYESSYRRSFDRDKPIISASSRHLLSSVVRRGRESLSFINATFLCSDNCFPERDANSDI